MKSSDVLATFTGVEFQERENFGNVIKMVFVKHSELFGDEQISATLISSDEINKDVFDTQKLVKSYSILSKQSGVELIVPEVVNLENVKNSLNMLVGTNIKLFILRYTEIDEEDGNKKNDRLYYSLDENNKGVVFANKRASDLEEYLPDISDSEFEGTFVSFNIEKNNKYFTGGKTVHEAKIIKETETRKGLAKYIAGILNNDESKFAAELKQRLYSYLKANETEDSFTTAGILQSIGVFSDKALGAEELDDITITKLEKLVSREKSSGRANIATLRAVFNLTEEGVSSDNLWRTTALYEKNYHQAVPYSFRVTFNPDDTNVFEFSNMLRPLEEANLIDSSEVEALKAMNDSTQIIQTMSKIILDNKLKLILRVTNLNEDKTTSKQSGIQLVGITKPVKGDENQLLAQSENEEKVEQSTNDFPF